MFLSLVTGAIRGTVHDGDGLPIAEAELVVAETPSTTYGYSAKTLASGEYLVPHVPAGSYGLRAVKEGYLSGFVKPVAVERGRIAAGPDFVLRPAPVLRGRITDVAGRPVEGARLGLAGLERHRPGGTQCRGRQLRRLPPAGRTVHA